jgi:hypothetical protein
MEFKGVFKSWVIDANIKSFYLFNFSNKILFSFFSIKSECVKDLKKSFTSPSPLSLKKSDSSGIAERRSPSLRS